MPSTLWLSRSHGHVPRLAEKRKLDPAVLLAAFQVIPIEWMPVSVYEEHREQAESRIAAREPDDWPTLALALKLGVLIWSQDKDFSTAGVEVVTTGELLDSLRAVGHDLRWWRPAPLSRAQTR